MLYNHFQSARHPKSARSRCGSNTSPCIIHVLWTHPTQHSRPHLDQFSRRHLLKSGPSRADLDPLPAHPSPHAKWNLHRFSRLCRVHDRYRRADRQTDRQTNRPRYSVCSNRPHLVSAAMRPKSNQQPGTERVQALADILPCVGPVSS